MEPASPSRRRVPEHHPARSAGAVIVRGRRRRRPAGEPPPLPRRLGRTGWWWLGLGTIAIIASIVLAGGRSSLPLHRSWTGVAEPLPPVDQRVLEGLAGLRTPALTRAMVVVAGLSAQGVIAALGWATILVLLAAIVTCLDSWIGHTDFPGDERRERKNEQGGASRPRPSVSVAVRLD